MGASLIVELCGRLAEPQGAQITITLDGPECAAAHILALAAQQHPPLAPLLAGTRIHVCVNEEIVAPDAPVRPGDLVALFPPVSGG